MSANPATLQISISQDEIAEFCRRWQITELAVFGSVLRQNFGPESDVDVLVTFSSEAHHSLFDFVQAQLELEDMLRRPVDLVEKVSLVNPYRRASILNNYRVIYAAERA
jgi:predicted nucleotidyltransferase